MVKIICDRCQEPLASDCKVGYVALNFRTSYNGSLTEDNPFEMMHFCETCMEKIRIFVTEPPESVINPLKNVIRSDDRKTEKKKKIDYGKIMALRKAGWSNAEIADEMHMTKASVATAISTYKKMFRGGVWIFCRMIAKRMKCKEGLYGICRKYDCVG